MLFLLGFCLNIANLLNITLKTPKIYIDTRIFGRLAVASSIKPTFSRKPYTIKYKDQKGEMQSIRRVPPPKLHDMLPTDKVSLNSKKNDDWDSGENFTIKGIAERQPNTIQIENEKGDYTFVSYYDLSLEEKISDARYEDPRDNPITNDYLIWP